MKIYLFNLEAALALRKDYQGPRKNQCWDKTLQQYCYKAVELTYSKFSGTFYYLEVSMPPLLDKSLEEHWHWTLFGEVLPISITL